jgi:hypothetical protein
MNRSISSVQLLISMVAACAAATIAATADATVATVADHGPAVVAILALTLVLQAVTLRLPGVGSISFASLGIVLAAISLGAGPAMVAAVLAALMQWIRRRGVAHRALFDAGNLALSAGAAAATYAGIVSAGVDHIGPFAAATAAGAAYVLVNHGLLCAAMSLAEHRPVRDVWRERFHWARSYLLAVAPLAGCMTVGDDPVGFGIVASLALAIVLLTRMRARVPRIETA